MAHSNIRSLRTLFHRLLPLFTFVFLIFGLAACGGSDEAATDDAIDEMPSWMASPPEDPNYLFGTASATSRNMQTAIDKAETQARGNIASQVETKFQSLTKQFQEEVGTGEGSEYLEQFTQAQKEVVNQVLNGTTSRDRKVVTEDGVYRAYILMEMPIGKASQDLLSKLQQNEEMYTRFRQSQAFEELEEEVEDYEQYEQQNRAPQDNP